MKKIICLMLMLLICLIGNIVYANETVIATHDGTSGGSAVMGNVGYRGIHLSNIEETSITQNDGNASMTMTYNQSYDLSIDKFNLPEEIAAYSKDIGYKLVVDDDNKILNCEIINLKTNEVIDNVTKEKLEELFGKKESQMAEKLSKKDGINYDFSEYEKVIKEIEENPEKMLDMDFSMGVSLGDDEKLNENVSDKTESENKSENETENKSEEKIKNETENKAEKKEDNDNNTLTSNQEKPKEEAKKEETINNNQTGAIESDKKMPYTGVELNWKIVGLAGAIIVAGISLIRKK